MNKDLNRTHDDRTINEDTIIGWFSMLINGWMVLELINNRGSGNSMLRSAEEWVLYAKQHHKYIVFYEEKVLDLTEFIHRHPGGKKALLSYIYKDVTDILFKVYKHQPEVTLGTLTQLIIGSVINRNRLNTYCYSAKSPSPAHKEKKKVCFKEQPSLQKENSSKPKRTQHKSKTHQPSKGKYQNRSSSKESAKSRQKSTKQQKRDRRFDVSIKLLEMSEDKVMQDRYRDWGSSHHDHTEECSPAKIDDDLEEYKPIFRVPVLEVKHMNHQKTS